MELTKKSFGALSANGKRPVGGLLKSQKFYQFYSYECDYETTG